MAWRSNLLFCRSCYNVYFASELSPSPLERMRYMCPNYFCAAHQELVPIDELMVKPIVELNKKGYLTAYCCSGHNPRECDPYADNAYIAFFTPVNSMPEGWYADKDPGRFATCIRSREPSMSRRIEALEKWVEDLPELEKENEDA